MKQPHVLINKRASDRIRQGHPWVFRSDILEVQGAQIGDSVTVYEKGGKFLAWAFFNPKSLITLRMITLKDEPLNQDFWRKRIQESIQRRKKYLTNHEALRLIFGESDLLPSLIVDQYQKTIVLQILGAGMDRLKETIIPLLEEILHPEAIVERNDVAVRALEGLSQQKGILRGGTPKFFQIKEGAKLFWVDPLEGQKTGLFLDQAENHSAVIKYAQGKVLDLFCYQGGFSIQVADEVEEIMAVDSSASALEMLRQNTEMNGIKNIHTVNANVFDFLRECQQKGETFDTIILDPPPFVRGKINLSGGIRGYKEINLRAMRLLKSSGILISCSCSQNFTPQLFEETLADAAHDAKRQLQILEKWGASPDHPVLLNFPESSYLQCWILRVI